LIGLTHSVDSRADFDCRLQAQRHTGRDESAGELNIGAALKMVSLALPFVPLQRGRNYTRAAQDVHV
jgi:hypothetical protein